MQSEDCYPYYGGGSVVLGTSHCLWGCVSGFVLVCITLCPVLFCNHLEKETRAGCFAFIVSWMSCYCKSVPWVVLQFVIVVFPDHTHLLLDCMHYIGILPCIVCMFKHIHLNATSKINSGGRILKSSLLVHMGCNHENLSSGFPIRPYKNQPAQLQRRVRIVKFHLLQVLI